MITFTFPAPAINAISATQTVGAGGGFAILNGSLAPAGNITPSATTATSISQFSRPVVLAGIARTITAFASTSATNCIFTIVGFDIRGVAQTATFIGASGGSTSASDTTATGSGVDFHVVTGVKVSASVANFTIGTGASSVSAWIETDRFKNPFAMSISVSPATSGGITVQDTPDDANAAAPLNIFNHATLVTVQAAQQSNYTFPVRFARAICAPTQIAGASSAGVVTFIQAGLN